MLQLKMTQSNLSQKNKKSYTIGVNWKFPGWFQSNNWFHFYRFRVTIELIRKNRNLQIILFFKVAGLLIYTVSKKKN